MVGTFPIQVKGLSMGFPCKSISPQNVSAKAFTDEDSTTGSGFKALVDYVDYAGDELEWVITENVRTLVQKRQSLDRSAQSRYRMRLWGKGVLSQLMLWCHQSSLESHNLDRGVGGYISKPTAWSRLHQTLTGYSWPWHAKPPPMFWMQTLRVMPSPPFERLPVINGRVLSKKWKSSMARWEIQICCKQKCLHLPPQCTIWAM